MSSNKPGFALDENTLALLSKLHPVCQEVHIECYFVSTDEGYTLTWGLICIPDECGDTIPGILREFGLDCVNDAGSYYAPVGVSKIGIIDEKANTIPD